MSLNPSRSNPHPARGAIRVTFLYLIFLVAVAYLSTGSGRRKAEVGSHVAEYNYKAVTYGS